MIVLKYVRLGNARFVSHIDVLRQMSRILRRAGITVKFSQGFNPHSLVYFSPPAALGIGSLAEYVAIDTDMSGEDVFARYNASVPEDMRATEWFAMAKNPNLAGRITAADYIFPVEGGLELGDEFVVEYNKKGEDIKENVRSRIYATGVSAEGKLTMKLAAGNTTLRADRVFAALKDRTEDEAGLPDTLKTAQYVTENGEFVNVDEWLKSMV